ncbi:hypothetical protein KPH14_001559 [Odynerus spinipes]|uniref:peptidylamidoglycolate lyase n=1 Tax=Odynerus spinipes TaxID=1348599 RepID=A0AAD9RZV2_9HYME|nr:hypothetical protein KPH14_001559 [Odynerus spinipes]
MEGRTWNNILRVFLIFVVFLLDDATSDIDGRAIFQRNGLDEVDEVDEPFWELLTGFESRPLQPVEDRNWKSPQNLGQVSGVSVDPSGNPVVFHRGDRVWGYDTFTQDNVYQEEYKGPIEVNTVLTLDPKTGDVIHGWGNHTFYLPHGIHIDGFGKVWLTDVALHQVFKYDSSGVLRLVLGQRFEPGNDINHFCQPTSVAVAPTGEIVVADGYCNRRIVLFDHIGNPLYSIQEPWVNLQIPHSLTILSDEKVCIADRENERVLCINAGLPRIKTISFKPPYSIPLLGQVYAVASYRDMVYAVMNGMKSRDVRTTGLTINPYTQSVVDFWSPESGSFWNPHDIGISPNGTALYVTEIGPNRVWKFNLM